MTIVNGNQIIASDFVSTSAGAGDSGKVAKLNASGKIDGSFFTEPVVTSFTSSGTWTKPSGLSHVFVVVQSAGGGGAGGSSGSSTAGGGGSGAYTEGFFSASELASTVTVTVGAAGAAGGNNANGSAGGTSSFGAHLVCTGGGGGTTGGAGGSAGAATTAGSFSHAGVGGSVGSGVTGSTRHFPQGASAFLSKGGRPSVQTFTNTTGTGDTDIGYGGGGATKIGDSVGSTWGGVAGLAGIVIVTEFY